MTERNPIPACLSHLEQMRPPHGPPKFCRDCKWCRYAGVANSACTHEQALEPAVNVVTGEPGQSPLYCINMRLAMGAPCGIEARLFEPAKP